MTLRRLHRLNGLFLIGFLLIHMATHLSGLWGIETYNATQKTLRAVYRAPLVEPLLLISLVAQVGLGIWLLIGAWRRGIRGFWAWAQALSGAGFLFFVLQHVPAFALARWSYGLDTTLYWPAAVMSGPPITWYFTPYYLIGVISVFAHLGVAARSALARQGRPGPGAALAAGLTAAGAVTGTLIVAMLLEGFYTIDLPPQWVDYVQIYFPWFEPG